MNNYVSRSISSNDDRGIDVAHVARNISMRFPFNRFSGSALDAILMCTTLSALVAGCAKSSSPTTPTTPTPDSATEIFTGTLPVGGSSFYSFSTAVDGNVTATLASIGGDGVPPSIVVNLGIGVPSGFTCTAGATQVQATGEAGVQASVVADEPPGIHCVQISDIGNLFEPATFTITIAHSFKATP